MPTTFSNGFYGGNPRVEGAGNHHDVTDGREENIKAAYFNLMEDAIETTQQAVSTLETRVNEIILWLYVFGVETPTVPASGTYLPEPV